MAETITELRARIEQKRNGVDKPHDQVALELRHITDLLLALLESHRRELRQTDRQ